MGSRDCLLVHVSSSVIDFYITLSGLVLFSFILHSSHLTILVNILQIRSAYSALANTNTNTNNYFYAASPTQALHILISTASSIPFTRIMASLWYCCECNFGPHNSALYEACIGCGERRCGTCVEEKVYDALRTHSHAHNHCHETSPYPSAVAIDTAHTLSLNTKSMPIALPGLAGIRPLSRLRPAPAASPFAGPAHMYSQAYIYICCKCGDGPKLWDNQPSCVSCEHVACGNCTYVK